MIWMPLLLLTTLTFPVAPGEVDEATKIAALKIGYALNGNSMVRWGSIDLTGRVTPRVKGDRQSRP